MKFLDKLLSSKVTGTVIDESATGRRHTRLEGLSAEKQKISGDAVIGYITNSTLSITGNLQVQSIEKSTITARGHVTITGKPYQSQSSTVEGSNITADGPIIALHGKDRYLAISGAHSRLTSKDYIAVVGTASDCTLDAPRIFKNLSDQYGHLIVAAKGEGYGQVVFTITDGEENQQEYARFLLERFLQKHVEERLYDIVKFDPQTGDPIPLTEIHLRLRGPVAFKKLAETMKQEGLIISGLNKLPDPPAHAPRDTGVVSSASR